MTAPVGLSDVAFWKTYMGTRVPSPNPRFDAILRRHAPGSRTCIELGGYPGSFAMHVAERYGTAVTLLDLRDDLADVEPHFRRRGLAVETIVADVLTYKTRRRWDLVVSHGFIEHFDDWQTVLLKHATLAGKSGVALVTMPCWSPFVQALRLLMYAPQTYEAITGAHNTSMMRLDTLREFIEDDDGLELLEAGYTQLADATIQPHVMPEDPVLLEIYRFFKSMEPKLGYLPAPFVANECYVVFRSAPAHSGRHE